MRYLVTIDGTERAIDVQITDAGTVDVSMDGAPVPVDAVRIPGGVSLRIGGKVFDLVAGGRAEAKQVAAGARRAIAEVESERARSRRARRGAVGGGGKEIRAPMPGRVVKILVTEGEEVTAEQPIIVVEAMKMENELRASADGRVQAIEVSEGQTVEGDMVLVRFA